jgi:hypothetical protein
MSQLLLWVTDEVTQTPVKEIMKIVLPKSWVKPQDDISCKLCTVCNQLTDGIPCGAENCPN